jgi:hypothetical protein
MFDYFRIATLSCALWWKMLSIARSLAGPAKLRGPARGPPMHCAGVITLVWRYLVQSKMLFNLGYHGYTEIKRMSLM